MSQSDQNERTSGEYKQRKERSLDRQFTEKEKETFVDKGRIRHTSNRHGKR